MATSKTYEALVRLAEGVSEADFLRYEQHLPEREREAWRMRLGIDREVHTIEQIAFELDMHPNYVRKYLDKVALAIRRWKKADEEATQ